MENIEDAFEADFAFLNEDPLSDEETNEINMQFFGWELYFPGEQTSTLELTDRRLEIVDKSRDFFTGNPILLKQITEAKVLVLESEFLINSFGYPDLRECIANQPLQTLPSISLGLYQIVNQDKQENERSGKLNVRIIGWKPLTMIKIIRANFVKKLISLRGTVIRVSAIKPLVKDVEFSCARCESKVKKIFEDGTFEYPSWCTTRGCKSHIFKPIFGSAKMVDSQRVRIQEAFDSGSIDAGRIPRTIDCEMTEDLVNQCSPGDVLTVTGIVKTTTLELQGSSGGGYRSGNWSKKQNMFYLYLEAHSLLNNKQKESSRLDPSGFSLKDLYAIRDIASDRKVFRLIVNSICPRIFGHEVVKAGLCLALFGGTQQNEDEKRGKLSIRSDPHVLVVGDPGLGKCLGKNVPIKIYEPIIFQKHISDDLYTTNRKRRMSTNKNNNFKKFDKKLYVQKFKMSQDIKIGDLLIGDDFKPRLVLSTSKGYGQLYKITQEHGQPYIVNKYHVLTIYDQEKNEIFDIEILQLISLIKKYKNRFYGVKLIPKKKELLTQTDKQNTDKNNDNNNNNNNKDSKNTKSFQDKKNINGEEKKNDLYKIYYSYTKIEIRKIKQYNEWFGFQISGNGRFLLSDNTVTHNSQMLKSLSNIAPRAFYVCGNTTTSAGLTVSVAKESTGSFVLDAGAVVLADRGICCIDEFDKMKQEHSSLLEVMEQQAVSIAKAGVVCSLPARCAIVCAANPTGGHYNKSKTIAENLKIGSALLSRFDLVFILLDSPDEEKDKLLSKKIMDLHSGSFYLNKFQTSEFIQRQRKRRRITNSNNGNRNSSRSRGLGKGRDRNINKKDNNLSLDNFFKPTQNVNTLPSTSLIAIHTQKDKPSLQSRLAVTYNEEFDPVPAPLLRKYVGYAKKYVNPVLSQESKKVILDFYINLRQKHKTVDGTPATTRQLESLIRLSQARAKIELREIVTKDDAEDVVEIMRESLFDTFSDEFGQIDLTRGSGMSKRKEVLRFIKELTLISKKNCKRIFTKNELRIIANDLHLKIDSFHDFIETLNSQNFLLKVGTNSYKIQID
ncbi:intein-containing DNA helicase mcm8 precursor [Anaeramoeba flamelloides]|uniref:DNA helicase n=1 Tax=Anaeramoeba flamelloides TaxID=1746091 RepID=A0AAV8A1I1_9EUKA|nr:intein-containing DNA helicase mcm8 precursor [Anaeramoeba flamelloides]